MDPFQWLIDKELRWINALKYLQLEEKKDIFIYFKIVSKEIPSKITPNKEIVNYSIQNG